MNPGSIIGPYVLDLPLGTGAFGSVYKAYRQGKADHAVALKVIESHGRAERLLQEPALLAKVRHPCIVGVEDYFLDGGRLILALEFVPGDDLKVCMDRGDIFTPDEVQTLLVQIGGALAAAHAEGIVHRDVKPANILVDRRDGKLRFVLTDFGIGQVRQGLQAKKHAGGTLLYMAPEQLRGRPGPQSDLWALGVIAYRLLTGQFPFPGPSLAELSRQIQYETPVPPGKRCGAAVPPDLEAAVVNLLDKSLAARMPSAEELLNRLGHRGDSQDVVRKSQTKTPARSVEPYERKLARQARWNLGVLTACIVIYAIPNGLVGISFLLAGTGAFFTAQTGEHRRPGRTLIALAFLGVSFLASRYPQYDLFLARAVNWSHWIPGVEGRGWLFEALKVVLVVLWIGLIFLPAIASGYYAALRRVRREQALFQASLAGKESEQYLSVLKGIAHARIEDVGLHLKYAEALFGRGDTRGAAIEARLLLEQDPYHFDGNLLLANAYAALGLPAEALHVCEEYLGVAGHCFEFSELADQCCRRLGVAACT